ncbi:MAG: 23S rRNA (guanosine(2251)-2'-O)-methyltransferase RlmB [Chloroflexi bacterium]|nr:23S rRNA (guanosine(2251)-2'-O)-methyltransferase RlmB [Chloroflexota bacterium]
MATEWLYGFHAVHEALRAGRRAFYALWLAEGLHPERAWVLQTLAAQRRVPVEVRPKDALTRVTGTRHHQGVALKVGPYPYVAFEDLLANLPHDEPALLLMLDQIQDPRNFAALLRTAEAVGVHGVIIPKRGQVGVTPTVVHVSAGAAEHLAIARYNLAQAITRVQAAGLWVYGLDAAPQAQPITTVDLRGPLAWVVGSEGQGLRRLVRERCDARVRLPMRGRVASLNASVAGAIALYFTWHARGFVGAHPPDPNTPAEPAG